MKHISANLIFSVLTLLLLSVVLSHGMVFAGDEDMLSPYMEFDPETGFFIPIDETARSDSHQTSAQLTQENLQELDTVIPLESPSSRQSVSQAWLLSAGIIIILGGIIWLRLSRKN